MTTALKAAEPPRQEEKKPELLSIAKALPLIIGAIPPITKNRKNEQQHYNFRGIDDVYAALNLLLAKYGVSILPEVLESKHEAAGTTKSGTTMWRHYIRVRYHLIASDGSTLKADSEGEGMDTGDKATPKAFSTAFKTMAFQVFCIPTGEKVDSEEDSPEVVAPKQERNKDEPIWKQVVVVAKEYGFDCGEGNKALWALAATVTKTPAPKWTEEDFKLIEQALASAVSGRKPGEPESDIPF